MTYFNNHEQQNQKYGYKHDYIQRYTDELHPKINDRIREDNQFTYPDGKRKIKFM
ncbi:MAG: hypothetical protein IKV59_02920 [Lachnospiraceae bacterium]|nr:hypothetical protein [Lachnospiraceae bacterium]